jgi:acetyl-CoA carboxylase carboxyltransferase component
MVEVVIGQKVSAQELGGAEMHAKISGSAHFVVDSEEEAAALAKKVLSYFPDHCDAPLPVTESKEPARDPAGIDDLIPEDPNRPYDMHRLIESLVDADSFLELKAQWAGELIVGFGRIGGRVVGIVANNPMVKVGAIFPESSDKGAEFVWLCDAYGIPLVYLCDTPGFMAGTAVERNSILRRGRKFIFATSSATVPRVCVVVRKAYGAGIYAMSGPAYDPDVTLGLPSAEIAVMGPHAAINAVYYNKLAAIADPQERERVTAELREDYRQSYDIFKRAGELVVDELILPRDLRKEVLRYIEIYREKQVELPRRKHGAIL